MIFKQALRFAFSGVIATAIHILVVTAFLRSIMPIPAIANGVAFIIASVFSYLMNTLWSFSSTASRKNLFRFIVVSSLGCLLAVVVSGIADWYGLDYRLGIALVVMCVPPITFLLHRYWTYQ